MDLVGERGSDNIAKSQADTVIRWPLWTGSSPAGQTALPDLPCALGRSGTSERNFILPMRGAAPDEGFSWRSVIFEPRSRSDVRMALSVRRRASNAGPGIKPVLNERQSGETERLRSRYP